MFLTILYFGLNKELVRNPRSMLVSFFGVQACGAAIVLVGTAGYAVGLFGEVPWQVLCGWVLGGLMVVDRLRRVGWDCDGYTSTVSIRKTIN